MNYFGSVFTASKNQTSFNIIGQKNFLLAHMLCFQCTQNGHIPTVKHKWNLFKMVSYFVSNITKKVNMLVGLIKRSFTHNIIEISFKTCIALEHGGVIGSPLYSSDLFMFNINLGCTS